MLTDFASRNMLNICVDGLESSDLYGRIYTRYAKNPFRFYGTAPLLLLMEWIYDEIAFPQPWTEHHSFRKNKESYLDGIGKGLSNLPKYDISCQKGEKASFLVHVVFRQNSTWQGTVTWVNGKKQERFRSALELIRLIDSATANTEIAKGEAEPCEKEIFATQ